ncbi:MULTISPECIES: hypothetical protein [unclassified Microbacterium]|uniref:deoxynucleotide monophosphate kinase family protein n=1 Tax=unclassified Microbacterium TaxID=2609290 RepID=UPI000EAA1197|nr:MULTISPECIES: hypothetical protein [unclassified Microbacterium]MBT2484760.1 hypothetical protein [Microbacterium sp. ISL-108]RKN67637.1 hypothetical protein D7252_08615 [Microbacterium sp. CGR2]
MNLSQPLIGLGGRLRSGKDAFADRLVDKHGYVKLGMSDALHEAMLAIDPIVEAYGNVYDTEVEFARYSELIAEVGYVEAKKIPEVRRLLQQLGTEVGRNMIGENVWVQIMARKIDDHRAAGHPVVVTGIRFPNEVRMIAQLGGQALWIERPGVHAPTAGTAAHASENSVSADDFHSTLLNDGTLAELEAKADVIAGHRSGERKVPFDVAFEDDGDPEELRHSM